jgi:hypothetical protein
VWILGKQGFDVIGPEVDIILHCFLDIGSKAAFWYEGVWEPSCVSSLPQLAHAIHATRSYFLMCYRLHLEDRDIEKEEIAQRLGVRVVPPDQAAQDIEKAQSNDASPTGERQFRCALLPPEYRLSQTHCRLAAFRKSSGTVWALMQQSSTIE